MKITIETRVNSNITDVWSAWTSPESITKWNFASEEWCCPRAESDLSPGGNFSYRMEAKDGSMGFDFDGTFMEIEEKQKIVFKLGDGRPVTVQFSEAGEGKILVQEIFEAEDMNSAEQQKQGWQCILNNFKKYVENR